MRCITPAAETSASTRPRPGLGIPGERERGSGIGPKLFGFIPDSIFTFIANQLFGIIPDSAFGFAGIPKVSQTISGPV